MQPMKILFLAPHPFFENRGTPIDVDLGLRALSQRGEEIDVLTFHLGQDVHYPGVKLYRIPKLPFIKEIAPGFSLKKLVADLFLLIKALGMPLRKKYDLVHAVEEAVFIALALKVLYRIPYVYDMDSDLAQQMVEKFPALKFMAPVLNFFEGLAVSNARAVAPVCDAISDNIQCYQPQKVVVIHDISLLEPIEGEPPEDIRQSLSLPGEMVMYVGNLEHYQGIDLLLESFARVLPDAPEASLVIIGGKASDIEKYRSKAQQLGAAQRVHLLGPRPIENLGHYLAQADIVVSPRIKGVNTPMKIFSYLDSGTVLLATRLLTHTQVLDDRVAMLAEPEPGPFAAAMLRLLHNPALRRELAQRARTRVVERHTYEALRRSYNTLYDYLEPELKRLKEARWVRILFSLLAVGVFFLA
jgi:glycosyltransferase involved in cell wall biosynthesis